MIVEGVLLVLGYFLLSGPIVYIAAAMKLMLGGILASVIGFLKATLGSFILLVVTALVSKVYKKSSESGSELEPTYSSADMEADEHWKEHYILIFMFIYAMWCFSSFRKCVALALFFIFVVGCLSEMNNK